MLTGFNPRDGRPPSGTVSPLTVSEPEWPRRHAGLMRVMPDSRGLREAAWIARCVGRDDLSPLAPEEADRLAEHLEPRYLHPGERLFAQGDTADTVWILRSGEVELAVRTGTRRRRVVEVLHHGDVTGDVEMLLGVPRPFGAWAVEESVVVGLDRGDFEALISRGAPSALRWMSSIAGRLAHSQERILQLLEPDLRHRLARVLLDEADDGCVRLPQGTLAELIGVRRPSVNKVLKEFEAAGWISLGYRRIGVDDEQALARIAS